MVNKVFVDTAAWLTLINKDDDLHPQAVAVRTRLQQKKPHLVTTDSIFLEVADALSSARFRAVTVSYLNRLRALSNLEVLPMSKSLLSQGWALYSNRLDQSWGLTDCISFVVMKQADITVAFTSDRHFEQAGFQRLLTP